MAIEGFQRGWFTPFTPPRLNGVMMQEVAEGGKREDPTSKQTAANANKDFLHGCVLPFEFMKCFNVHCGSHQNMEDKASDKVVNRS